jgi:hypothetical protein
VSQQSLAHATYAGRRSIGYTIGDEPVWISPITWKPRRS